MLADATTVQRWEAPGVEPVLWFARTDVDLDGLPQELWTAGAGDLEGWVRLDHDEVDVELTESAPPADAADTTVRFPNWGDATDLVEVMDVAPLDGRCFRSVPRPHWRRPVVEASQMLGQAIVAAGRLAPDRRTVHASMAFTRPADAASAYEVALDPVSEGRTFSAWDARVTQGDRTCATGTVLADVGAPEVIGHQDDPPDVGAPADAEPFDMGVTGRDLRVVDGAYTGDPEAPVGPPELDAWVRFRRVPDDRPLHAGLLAQFTGHLSIAAALRAHAGVGEDSAHVTLSTAINAISLALHAPVHVDRWLLYHHRSTVASAGMTHSECRVYEEGERVVASFTVDAMVRAFADPTRPGDPARSL